MSTVKTDGKERDLLTVEQVAEFIQISQSSVRSYIRSGRLSASRVAGMRLILITRESMLGLLEPLKVLPLSKKGTDCP